MMRPGSVMLIIGYVAGFAVIAQQLLSSATPDSGPVEAAPINLVEAAVPPLVSLSRDAYDAIIERPLFRADRAPASETDANPVPSQSVAQAERSADITGLRLSAVIRGANVMTALLELADGKSRSVAEGDRIDNWTVDEILDDRLVLTHRDQRVTLNVYDFSYLTNRAPSPRARSVAERRRPASRRIPRTQRRLPEASRPPREGRTDASEDND
jgi:hypothetical protein